GVNIAEDLEGWNEIEEEKDIDADPDVIIYSEDLVDSETDKPLEDLITEREGWDKITAIKDDQLVAVEDNLVTRIGPRVTEALNQIAEGIYPDKYSTED